MSTSLFVKPEELTKTGDFKKNTKIYKEIEALLTAYQNKCNAMQTDLNHYSLEHIFKLLKFGEQKEKQIDFIAFSREWLSRAPLKRTETYETAIRSVMSFIGREHLNISEINVAFLTKYAEYLKRRSDERNRRLASKGMLKPNAHLRRLFGYY